MGRRFFALVVALYLLLVFIDRFVLIELFVRRVGVSFLLACCAALACIGAGFLARGRASGVATNLAVGYPIFGTACFLVGLLKISAWTMVPLLALFAIAGLFSMWPPTSIEPVRSWQIAVVFVFVCGFVAAQAPPNALDELAYHLAIPWEWAKEGRAVVLPLISHSYFPLGVESADLPLLSLLGVTSGGIASHMLHLFAAAAATALLFAGDGLLVAAIVSAPVLAITAGWSLVDWNLLAAAMALYRAVEADDRRTMGAALAAGLLTKYTFIPFAAIVLFARRDRLKHWIPLLCGAAAGSIFFIRNLVIAGNPFAPFLSPLAPHLTQYREGASLSQYVFDGRFIDESLGASLLSTAAATTGVVCWLVVIFGGILFLLRPSARILVPFFAVPASRASIGWRPLRWLMAIVVALQLFLLAYFVDRSGAFGLMAGRQSDDEFLAASRASYTTVRAVDASLPAASRTLIVGMNETFWFAHRVRGGGNFDGPRVSHYLTAPSSEALRERLRRDGITHVAVFSLPPPTTQVKKREERETTLTPEAQRSLAQMLDHYAASVTQRQSATVFALR